MHLPTAPTWHTRPDRGPATSDTGDLIATRCAAIAVVPTTIADPTGGSR
jgi:hypothetical protein